MIVTTFSVLLLFITRATAAAADCNQALGMQNGAIKNEAITASSWKDDDHKAQFARLKTRKAWCSGNETSPYLQISLSEVYKITGIATQGSLRDRQWVSEYKIYYTTTTSAWKVHQASNGKSIFQGNSNFGATLRNDFSIPIIANIIRIYPTETRFLSKGPKRACLRVEIYGCKKQAPCPPPNRPANGQRYGSDFRHEKRVRFSCNYGYQIIGASSATCNDGKWNSDPPVCKGICRDPGNPLNGRIVNSKRQYLEGDLIEFSCWNGFDLFGENKTYCRNRNWDAVRPNCRDRCRDPGVPQHSFVEQEKFRIKNEFRHGGGEIKYKCRAGYTMVGDATLQCNDGRWSSAVPQCKVPCLGPDVPRNGRVIGNDLTHGKTVSFECARGYKVVGASSLTCQNGNWSDSTPVCKVPPFKCNFDISSCGFAQSENDDFDWRRHRGSTYSWYTGPSRDVSGSGYYMYIEATDTRHMKSKRARIEKSGMILNKGQCLSFYYHMYGSNIGTLKVFVGNTEALALSGNKGNQWLKITVKIATASDTLAFEATVGPGKDFWKSDIAIDNISISNCST